MPPMDPAMMGGAPPMPLIDPATGMPIDPATGMPIDPAMMGGAPPEAGDDVVKVSMDDLKALVEEVVGEKGSDKPSRRATNSQIMDKLTELESILSALVGAPPPSEVGLMPKGIPAEDGNQPGPEDLVDLMQGGTGGMLTPGSSAKEIPMMQPQASGGDSLMSLIDSLKGK